MTLAAQITSDVSAVFHRTDDFAQEIIHYQVPGGQPETISAIVDYDVLDPAVGRFGVASVITDELGVKVKERAILEISSSVEVTEERAGGRYGSTFEIDGAIWVTKRVTGKDSAMQSVEVARTDQKATRRMS